MISVKFKVVMYACTLPASFSGLPAGRFSMLVLEAPAAGRAGPEPEPGRGLRLRSKVPATDKPGR
eukprot:2750511-Lingulodinium_polyedra.AAC.1